MEQFSKDMMSNLFGNPHSASPSSQLSSRRIDEIRLRVLRFFCADPNEFDVVFVANATAGMKLLLEIFRDYHEESSGPYSRKGFWFGYHHESHTSLIGMREVAGAGSRCFESDEEVETWLSEGGIGTGSSGAADALFGYPAQSNMTGRRLPLDWCGRLRRLTQADRPKIYSLLDAAALVSTAPLDLSDAAQAPDFTVLSFYKIFGFPDLGALILRKSCAPLLGRRKYFGGGTVDMVVCSKENWHAKKTQSLHDQLEDGTVQVHNIIALDSAFDIHERLFGDMSSISRHATYLVKCLYEGLSSLRHHNGQPVCEIYNDGRSEYGDSTRQGPVVAFNIRDAKADWISNVEVEKLATIRNIHIRTGGLCNPGGVASFLQLAAEEMKQNFADGQRCEPELEGSISKPTGAIRVSLGAMSNLDDVNMFIKFIREFFVPPNTETIPRLTRLSEMYSIFPTMCVKTLTIYPIKSCAGWNVRPEMNWDVLPEGLALDREWCLVHLGSGAALSQKACPKMALIRPSIDLENGVLRIRADCSKTEQRSMASEIIVPLRSSLTLLDQASCQATKNQGSRVCGDVVTLQRYTSEEIARFFSSALGVACTLARFPAGGPGASCRQSKVNAHDDIKRLTHAEKGLDERVGRPILLSNESPILIISQSSVDHLNTQIEASGGRKVNAESFRANVVIDETDHSASHAGLPYIEDSWESLHIGRQKFKVSIPGL